MTNTRITLFICLLTAIVCLPVVADDFILVEGGTFQMGSDSGEDDEGPIHEVTISSFYIAQYEVTQGLWMEVMDKNPSLFEGTNRPVERLNWYSAVEFCNALSERDGLTPCYSGSRDSTVCDFTANGYRLPTEAEWEYAAGGGKDSIGNTYSGSNSPDAAGWHKGNSDRATHDVGTSIANELGIYDMSGNVHEWCWDWYGGNYYSMSPDTNPRGPEEGAYKILRGGSWYSDAEFLEVTARKFRRYASRKDADFGFRLVRTAD